MSASSPPSGWRQSKPTDADALLRVATYNIHKGVRGMGLTRRLEIHNLSLAVEALDADVVCLQEVRRFHAGDAQRFRASRHGALAWPAVPQAQFLAPLGYEAAYRTNAVTRQGEHGNALLSRWPMGDIRHCDVSDHRFEQRGVLQVPVYWQDQTIHVWVIHFGLLKSSRLRQAQQLAQMVHSQVREDETLVVAGDFNDWSEELDEVLRGAGLERARLAHHEGRTFPSAMPLLSLDRVYSRGMRCVSMMVPKGAFWRRISDHLPLVVDLERAD